MRRSANMDTLRSMYNSPVTEIDPTTGQLGVAINGTVYIMTKDGLVLSEGDDSNEAAARRRFEAYQSGSARGDVYLSYDVSKNVVHDLATQYRTQYSPRVLWGDANTAVGEVLQGAKNKADSAARSTWPFAPYIELNDQINNMNTEE